MGWMIVYEEGNENTVFLVCSNRFHTLSFEYIP
jgi:hypothetical protein